MTITETTTVPPPPISPQSSLPAGEPPFSLPKIWAGLLLVIAGFDACFWLVDAMGFSVAVFVLVLALAILMNRTGWRLRRSTLVILLLLAGACLAAAIETGTTNTLVIFILIVALAGDSCFDFADPAWSRWFSQIVALAFAPGRLFWLAARMLESTYSGTGRMSGLLGGFLLALPALVLTLIFGSLLATGNTVFGSWTSYFFHWFWVVVDQLFDFDRIVMWLLIGFLALPLLRPARISVWWWSWMPRVRRWPDLIPARGAAFSSGLVLLMLNALFAMANAADAMYLWTGRVPAGINYSGYVHEGVNALTFTVLLSAVVLAGIFQQPLNVAGQRGLKALGVAWIAQNLFLLVSVVLRLKLYIEAYDMTVARLSVILFLLLVAAGFGLLAIKIVRETSLPWLVGRCALAIFTTFYIAQFLNLAGWSANYNVARSEQNKARNLDTYYLYKLGPAAWPALRRAHAEASYIHVLNEYSDEGPNTLGQDARAKFDTKHWREFSLLAYWNRWALEDKK